MKRLISKAKYTKNNFIETLKNEGFVMLDEDGRYKYLCLKVNTDNFNLTEDFVEQLKKQNKYNYYIGFICDSSYSKPFDQSLLPIYGSSDEWITKWFKYSVDDAVMPDLNDRSLKLLKRANEYLLNNI